MTFKKRDEDDNIHIEDTMTSSTAKTMKFKLLDICEFTSTRKRQSCIYRDENGKIFLLCKGADSVIKERLT
jgi:phospholipid-translocating ATPase